MKIRPRIIPILLLKNSGLVKTIKFKDPKYIGDPINAVKIFNEKEVDELIFLDILASKNNKEPDFDTINNIASECFMPLSYGGGIRSIEIIREVLNVGVEKVVLNTHAFKNPELINKSVEVFGSSTIIISIDIKKSFWGKYEVYINGGQENTHTNPLNWAKEIEKRGAGEIMVNSIDQDGTLLGYDFDLVKEITSNLHIPVIAAGGASSISDFVNIFQNAKVAAAAAGSLFVFQGKHRAVLITYPTQEELKLIFN